MPKKNTNKPIIERDTQITNPHRVAATKVPMNQTDGMVTPVGYSESSKKQGVYEERGKKSEMGRRDCRVSKNSSFYKEEPNPTPTRIPDSSTRRLVCPIFPIQPIFVPKSKKRPIKFLYPFLTL